MKRAHAPAASRRRKGTFSRELDQTGRRAVLRCLRNGRDWEGCQQYCPPNATFSAQTGALAGVDTLQAHTDWMKGLFTPVPDGQHELQSFVDEDRKNVAAATGIGADSIPARVREAVGAVEYWDTARGRTIM